MKTQLISGLVMLLALVAACSPAIKQTIAVPVSVSPPTVPPPTAPAIALDLPTGSTDYAGEEQPAGLYKTPRWFSIPFTFETTQPFRGMAEVLPQGQLFGIGQGERTTPEKQLLFWILAPDISTTSAISKLHETPSLEFTSNEKATIAGISGTQFDVTYPGEEILGINLGAMVGAGARTWSANSPHAHLRLILLSQAGRTMLIYIEAPEAEFEEFVKKANSVLETIQFSS
jgi:hypothetical protein